MAPAAPGHDPQTFVVTTPSQFCFPLGLCRRPSKLLVVSCTCLQLTLQSQEISILIWGPEKACSRLTVASTDHLTSQPVPVWGEGLVCMLSTCLLFSDPISAPGLHLFTTYFWPETVLHPRLGSGNTVKTVQTEPQLLRVLRLMKRTNDH